MRALISGVTGQDGAYLAKFLLEKGYDVFGTHRPSPTPNTWRLKALKIEDVVTLLPMDLTDGDSIDDTIHKSEPDEIYNLAAQSHVRLSFDIPILTMNVNGMGPWRILRRIRHSGIKFYQASTSELYGNSPPPQSETTPMLPVSPYGWAKLAAHQAVSFEREAFGTFACAGILFNHESPLRGDNFVTQKICKHIREKKPLVLGNLDARRDWGHARDYVRGMWMMMQMDEPDDYVLATGETRSVREFLATACRIASYTPEIRFDGDLTRPMEVNELRGNYIKAAEKLGWNPTIPFEMMVEEMLFGSLSS